MQDHSEQTLGEGIKYKQSGIQKFVSLSFLHLSLFFTSAFSVLKTPDKLQLWNASYAIPCQYCLVLLKTTYFINAAILNNHAKFDYCLVSVE